MKKDFIDVSPDTGSNNGKLSVVASKNTGAERSTLVNVSGGGVSKTLTVNQKNEAVEDCTITINSLDNMEGMSFIESFRCQVLMGDSNNNITNAGTIQEDVGYPTQLPKSFTYSVKPSKLYVRLSIIAMKIRYGDGYTGAIGKSLEIYANDELIKTALIKAYGASNQCQTQVELITDGYNPNNNTFDLLYRVV